MLPHTPGACPGRRYRAIIDNIRRYMPDASLSGDAIVGFPGETEEQYLATEALVREVGFDRVNTAAYSPRPNTPAAERADQVADLIKADRLVRLNAVVNEVATERSQRFQVGTLFVCDGAVGLTLLDMVSECGVKCGVHTNVRASATVRVFISRQGGS